VSTGQQSAWLEIYLENLATPRADAVLREMAEHCPFSVRAIGISIGSVTVSSERIW
jgi:hypothetical protein